MSLLCLCCPSVSLLCFYGCDLITIFLHSTVVSLCLCVPLLCLCWPLFCLCCVSVTVMSSLLSFIALLCLQVSTVSLCLFVFVVFLLHHCGCDLITIILHSTEIGRTVSAFSKKGISLPLFPSVFHKILLILFVLRQDTWQFCGNQLPHEKKEKEQSESEREREREGKNRLDDGTVTARRRDRGTERETNDCEHKGTEKESQSRGRGKVAEGQTDRQTDRKSDRDRDRKKRQRESFRADEQIH